ncbi:MAG: efflux RND transporter permease subunit [Gammaproteobacteria bacterium]
MAEPETVSRSAPDRRERLERVGGGLAAWSIRHPIGVTMITLALVVLGGVALQRLTIDLLPHIIYPSIGVRVNDPGVPASIMEDQVTRQLEEQLAITEDAIAIESSTTEGRSAVELSFPYGKDVDISLRDASARLDRAKRFLPDTIDPPVIFKRDPAQIPAAEYVVRSPLRDPVELTTWVEDVFAKWFLNLDGVAATEVGGGVEREIQILPDLYRLAALGLTYQDLEEAIRRGNLDEPAGRLDMVRQSFPSRTQGRFTHLEQIRQLPLRLDDGRIIRLSDLATVVDGHEEKRLHIRVNGVNGIKLSIQKQPTANTVAVIDQVESRLRWLHEQSLVPEDIEIFKVEDESLFIRNALRNAWQAAGTGALLAMLVVYLFLGNLRRTLIIGSAIPIAVMVTFFCMAVGDLTLNVMTLGGLAVGVGMLVDSTIVMMENIVRHQRGESFAPGDAVVAAAEVNSPIVASTSTNLAAILPFLFAGGLVGLLFRELIFTISAAIFASMLVALTLVPAYASRIPLGERTRLRAWIDGGMKRLEAGYSWLVERLLRHLSARLILLAAFVSGLVTAVPVFQADKQIFLPNLDDGRVYARILADPGVSLEELDRAVKRFEEIIQGRPEVLSVFTISGGNVFGRSQYEQPNRATIKIQLVPRSERPLTTDQWIGEVRQSLDRAQLAGMRIRLHNRGIRGIRTSRGDDQISLRIQGDDLQVLRQLGEEVAAVLSEVDGLTNVEHTGEEVNQELIVVPDRDRLAALDLDLSRLGRALRIALDGVEVSEFLAGDRAYPIRMRLAANLTRSPRDLESLLLFPASEARPAVHLGDVARVLLRAAPARIQRDNQRRITEVSAGLKEGFALGAANEAVAEALQQVRLPPGYSIYDAGAAKTLQEGRQLTSLLLPLALFLVFAVMAVQYESLRNPLVIMFCVPFAVIGVALGLRLTQIPLSMPVWLGLIMLAGIVVNNAIVLVEYIDQVRRRGQATPQAIVIAARLRLRPILMTTLTTAVGMLPLAVAWGEGAEMLQPLAITIVSGLTFSLLVTLLLIPLSYSLFHRES